MLIYAFIVLMLVFTSAVVMVYPVISFARNTQGRVLVIFLIQIIKMWNGTWFYNQVCLKQHTEDLSYVNRLYTTNIVAKS